MINGSAISILIVGFLLFWTFGMVPSLASSGCINGLTQPERTDRACRISKFGRLTFHKIGQSHRPSDSILYIGYAVASFRAGEIEQANHEFQTAYDRGSRSRHSISLQSGFPIPEALFKAFVRVHHDHVPTEARALWYEILQREVPDLVEALNSELAKSQSGDTE